MGMPDDAFQRLAEHVFVEGSLELQLRPLQQLWISIDMNELEATHP